MDLKLEPNQTLDDLLRFALNAALVKINASAGSIMMLDETGSKLCIKARLGAPRAGRKNEPVFDVNSGGIASAVVRTRNSRCTPDAAKAPDFIATQPGSPHFKSLLCAPITAGDKVYGVINADHEEPSRFTISHQTQLEEVAQLLGSVVAERISIPEALRRMTAHLTCDTADGDTESILQEIADDIRNALGADIVILYQYDHESKKFVRTRDGIPTISGTLNHPEYMKTEVRETDGPYQVLLNQNPIFIDDVNAQTEEAIALRKRITRIGQENPNRDRFALRERISSLVGLPLIHMRSTGPEFVGVLFINYRHKQVFNIDETTAMLAFAEAAASAILSARREDQNRIERTGLCHRIHRKFHRLLNDRTHEGQTFLAHFAGAETESFVMAIDIRKSTDLMLHAKTPTHFEEFISEIEGCLKNAVRENHGIVDKFTGDGLLAYFPAFLCGEDAGMCCLRSATECHRAFKDIYERKRTCFQLRPDGVGLGIGVDYGQVHFRMAGQELIAVGRPVVFACRFSSVDSGHTVFNEQAASQIQEKYAVRVRARDVVLPLKREGECIGIDMSLVPCRDDKSAASGGNVNSVEQSTRDLPVGHHGQGS